VLISGLLVGSLLLGKRGKPTAREENEGEA